MCCGGIFPDDQNVDGVKATNDAAKAKRVISPSVLTQAIERDHSKNHWSLMHEISWGSWRLGRWTEHIQYYNL